MIRSSGEEGEEEDEDEEEEEENDVPTRALSFSMSVISRVTKKS